MEVHDRDNRFALDLDGPTQRAMVASGVWLRVGFVALSVEVIALIMLATGEASPWVAIAAAAFAGLLARWSWHQARAALDVEAAATDNGGNAVASIKPRAEELGGRAEIAVSR